MCGYQQEEQAERLRIKELEDEERRAQQIAGSAFDKTNPPQKLTFGFQKKKSSLF